MLLISELLLIVRQFLSREIFFPCVAGATGVLIVCYFIPILNHYLMWFGRSVSSNLFLCSNEMLSFYDLPDLMHQQSRVSSLSGEDLPDTGRCV